MTVAWWSTGDRTRFRVSFARESPGRDSWPDAVATVERTGGRQRDLTAANAAFCISTEKLEEIHHVHHTPTRRT
jgi:hypothetical protein